MNSTYPARPMPMFELLDAASAGIVLFDSDDRCSYANAVACRLLGYPPADFTGVGVMTLLGCHPDRFSELCRQPTGTTRVLSFLRADGTLLDTLASTSCLSDQSRMLVIQDAAALTDTLAMLRHDEAHYRALVEVTSDWLWEVDPTGVYTYASPRVRDLMGYEPEEVLGRSAFDFMPADERRQIRDFYLEIAARRESFIGVTNNVICKDGKLITVESSGVPVFDGEGRLLCYRGIDRDITERRRIELALEKSHAALAEAQRIARLGNWELAFADRRFEWSDECYRILGVNREDFDGTLDGLLRHVHPEDRPAVRRSLERMERERRPLRLEHRIIRPDGGERIVEVRAEVRFSATGAATHLFGTVQDVTEQRTTENGMQQLARAMEDTREGVLIMDADRRVMVVNKAFSDLTGFSAIEMLGKNPFQMRASSQGQKLWQTIWQAVERNGRWEGEVQGERRNGEFYTERLTISALHDHQRRVVNFIAVISDISRQKQSEEQLNYLATHDTLTGLPNREALADRIRQLMVRGKDPARGFALVLIDIDGFETINSTLGHMTGNQILHISAERLQAALRRHDFVARLGGDDFGLIIEGVSDPRLVEPLVEKLSQALSQPITIGRDEIETSISIGVAFHPANGDDPESLMKHADTALHRAKATGRGARRFYSPDMTQDMSEQFSLERALRRALRAGDGLSIHYQPQLSMTDGTIVGVEALMRWEDPDLGPISPARFIPLVEQSGLIHDIGKWALYAACAGMRQWLDRGLAPIRMAVNVSSREITAGRLVNNVSAALKHFNIPPHLLEIEMTESSLMEDTTRAYAVLRNLKDLGVWIAVDDFGTGYSSLNYLKSFPLDILKIDKSFIDGIPGDEHDEAIARAIIAMAHGLKLQVTAEGVETEQQRAFLQAHGCDFMQGYLLSRPLPLEAFLTWYSGR